MPFPSFLFRVASARALRRLRTACERAKRTLSTSTQVIATCQPPVSLPPLVCLVVCDHVVSLMIGVSGNRFPFRRRGSVHVDNKSQVRVSVHGSLSRLHQASRTGGLSHPLVLVILTLQVLSDAKKDKSDVDEIVLVGGSTRIPKVDIALDPPYSLSDPRND